MTLDDKVQEAFKIAGVIMKNPDDMSATEVRDAYRTLASFVTGLLIGSVLTYDKVKEAVKK